MWLPLLAAAVAQAPALAAPPPPPVGGVLTMQSGACTLARGDDRRACNVVSVAYAPGGQRVSFNVPSQGEDIFGFSGIAQAAAAPGGELVVSLDNLVMAHAGQTAHEPASGVCKALVGPDGRSIRMAVCQAKDASTTWSLAFKADDAKPLVRPMPAQP